MVVTEFSLANAAPRRSVLLCNLLHNNIDRLEAA